MMRYRNMNFCKGKKGKRMKKIKSGYDKEGNLRGSDFCFTKDFGILTKEESELMQQFTGCSKMMRGIPPHYSKQLYFNFEGEENVN